MVLVLPQAEKMVPTEKGTLVKLRDVAAYDEKIFVWNPKAIMA